MAGALGNSVRNSIRGPGSKNVDLALTRNFRLSNTQNFELRAEAFNAFNWFQWGQPATTRSSRDVRADYVRRPNSARIIQLAVKYAF